MDMTDDERKRLWTAASHGDIEAIRAALAKGIRPTEPLDCSASLMNGASWTRWAFGSKPSHPFGPGP